MRTSFDLPRLPERRTRWLFIGGLSLLTFAVYFLSLGNEFVAWDDLDLIVNNPFVHRINSTTLKHIFTTYDPELYIPLTLLSYQLDYLIAGVDPSLFHLHNLLLHLLTSLLVGWIALLLSAKRSVALITALLFAVHPLHADAVAWVSGRKDVQAAFFALLSMLLYIYARARGDRRLFWGSVGIFFLALLSKVSVVILPLLLLLIDYKEGRRGAVRLLSEKWAFFLLSILFGVIALFGKTQFLTSTSPLQNVLLAGKAALFYLGKILVPIRLSLLYPYTESIGITSMDLVLSVLAVVVISIVAWMTRRFSREIIFGWAFFLVSLLPSFVQFTHGDDIGDIYFASDRYAYLASIGILYLVALLASWLLERGKKVRTISTIATGIVIAAFALLTLRQSLTWKTTETLFSHVLKYYPNSHVAHVNIGNHYQRMGDLRRAVEEYEMALNIRPTALAYFNLGKVFLQVGMYEEAIEVNQEAIKLDPNASMAQLNIGAAYAKQEKNAEAIEAFRQVIAMDPAAMEPYFNLGLLYEREKRPGEAIAAYEQVLLRSPQMVQALGRLAVLSLETGNRRAAGDYAIQAANLDPTNRDAASVLQKLRE